MSWIKRNLYFVICMLVALGLMGYGGYTLYTAYNSENEVSEQIQKLYTDLDNLQKQNPHPGRPGKDQVDNVDATRKQEATLKEYIANSRKVFVRPPPIPDTPKVSDKDFKTELSTTIALLNRSAKEASVGLPSDYYFTFQSQRSMLQFDPGSAEKLASHLGEIKVICEILFAAKVNYLDAIQREVISQPMDSNNSDYLADKTMATALGDLTPYRVVFRCFSAELAQVLNGLANSPYGLIVKTINVEPAEITDDATAAAPVTNPNAAAAISAQQAFQNRYGIGPGSRYGDSRPKMPPPVAPPTTTTPPPTKPTVMLTEHPVKVTLMIEVVKLKSETAPAVPAAGKPKLPK